MFNLPFFVWELAFATFVGSVVIAGAVRWYRHTTTSRLDRIEAKLDNMAWELRGRTRGVSDAQTKVPLVR